MTADFKTVAVLGLGAMGGGIAQVVAESGRTVIALEVDARRLEVGLAQVDAFLGKGVRLGKTTEEQRRVVLDRIHGTCDLADVGGADLVIEAVAEQADVKAQLWGQVSSIVSESAVLATNTSALSVTGLASSVSRPERFAGLHFFNPAQLMPLVEVVRGLRASDEVIADLMTFCSDIGKSGVVVKDRPGFLVNRLLMPYLNDVISAYDDGLASAEDIDLAIELGLGHPMGPLRLLDKIGLDVHCHATNSAYESTRAIEFAAPPVLERMVSAGMHGEKSGLGFRVGTSAERDAMGTR